MTVWLIGAEEEPEQDGRMQGSGGEREPFVHGTVAMRGIMKNVQANDIPSVSVSTVFSSEMYFSVLGKFCVGRGQNVSDRSYTRK